MTERRYLRHLPEAVEVEQIRTLFHAFLPSVIMTCGFIASGTLAVLTTGDQWLLLLLLLGTIASVARLAVAGRLASEADRPRLDLVRARQLQRRFAAPYLAFAALLGLFGLRAFMLPFPELHMLTIAMLVGYCAGVALGIGLRTWIAAPSMIISTVPALVTALFMPDPFYWIMSGLVGAFIAGGTNSLRARYKRSVQDINLRLAFASLAREDPLTALPNRIALHEWFDERASGSGNDGLFAVHYIDLNDFKPVNDSFGHPVGDALLSLVGKRIARTIRQTDIAARLGGDEFAVIQHGLGDPAEADQLATRLAEAIARPYRIGEHLITISTGLGYVVANGRDEDLDHLLGLADKALYTSKRGDGGIVQYEAVESIQDRAA